MKKICAHCGSELSRDEGYWVEGLKGNQDVCSECYYDTVWTCHICDRDDLMPSQESEFLLFRAELSLPHRFPGIYLELGRPFLHGSMLGPESLETWQVLFVDVLPKSDDEYEISGHICNDCAPVYRQKLKLAYQRPRSWLASHRFRDHRTWILERHHTRKALLDNPERVRDLEMSPTDSDWIDLRETYLLPLMATYRPWPCLTYKGVTVYYVYSGSHTSWMTVNPDPEFRTTYKSFPTNFSAQELPTWRRPKWKEYPHHQYEWPAEDREALIMAIDQGILTQQGFKP